MSIKKQTTEAGEELGGAFSKVETFIEENKTVLGVGTTVVLLLLAGFLYVNLVYLPSQEASAQEEIFLAQMFFEQDSFNLALNGNIEVTGFLEIIDEFKWTKAANLAQYYAGISYLHLKEYDNAIEHLKNFKARDEIVGAIALSAIGDAYMEQGKDADGLSYYSKAARYSDNSFSAPMLLQKLAQAYERSGKYAEAKKQYEQIKSNYPESQEASNADKYIARIKGML